MSHVRVLHIARVAFQILLLRFQFGDQIVELDFHRFDLVIFDLGCKISCF